jgi:hypothetical protein
MVTCLSSCDVCSAWFVEWDGCPIAYRTYLCSTSLGRVLLVFKCELGCALAPLGLGNDIHHPGDMETASKPGGLGCDWVSQHYLLKRATLMVSGELTAGRAVLWLAHLDM